MLLRWRPVGFDVGLSNKVHPLNPHPANGYSLKQARARLLKGCRLSSSFAVEAIGFSSKLPAGDSRIMYGTYTEGVPMVKFLLWVILLVISWPLALLALVLYPIVWVLLLPFRLVGIAVEGILAFFKALVLLPARVLGGTR